MEHRAPGQGPTTSGYYARDVAFRSGVVQMQTPLVMAYTAASQGIVPPDPRGPLTYCDLGCGDGTTLNALASLYPEGYFVGIDFNPDHIDRAKRTAQETGLTNVHFMEASFADVDPGDLPSFDFVGMNGIYSWLEEDLLRYVRNLLKACIKPGGLFYVEFTTLPGSISQWPLWHLIQGLVPPDAGDDSRQRAQTALNLLEKLVQGGMAYLQAHPQARRAALSYIQNRKNSTNTVDHFAHNALASGFRPRFFTEMAAEMKEAELTYVGSAQPRFNELEIAVPPGQASLVREVDNPDLRELLKDYITNTANRRAVWVRDGTVDPARARDFLFETFYLVPNRSTMRMPRYISRPDNSRLDLTGGGYDRVFNELEGPGRRVADLPVTHEVSGDLLMPTIRRLVASGEFTLSLQEPREAGQADVPQRVKMPNAINRRLVAEAAQEERGCPLISPVTGGRGAFAGPLHTLFLDVWLSADRDSRLEMVAGMIPEMTGTIRFNGADINRCDLTREQLSTLLTMFDQNRVPRLFALGILEAMADDDGAADGVASA